MIALPFASLIAYAAHTTQDLVAVHSAVRTASHTKVLPAGSDITFTCGATSATVTEPCAPALPRGSYLSGAKDTTVTLPFGLTLHTNAHALGRVG